MRSNNKFIHYGMIVLIFGVGFFTLLAHTVLHASFHSHTEFTPITYTCATIGQTHEIDINNNVFIPSTLSVKQCDVVLFKNIDTHTVYLPAFGEHPSHFSYPGFKENVLGINQENVLLATLKGTYSFHDHLQDKAEGTLTVK